MTKTEDEKHQEELQKVSKELLDETREKGLPQFAFDPEAILAIRKRREEKEKRLAEKEAKKESKKEEKEEKKSFKK